jgi:hypothetical protein
MKLYLNAENNGTPGTMFHSFTMKKVGPGYRTIEYRSSDFEPHDYFTKNIYTNRPIPSEFATLSKIKRDFEGIENLFVFTVEGHYNIHTTLIQVIVECQTEQQFEEVKNYYALKNTCLFWNNHTKYKWLTNVPAKVMKTWVQK